ncbi:MAG: alkaline phosphatase family protein [Firmicutes bacterium]|nr:alkaline phosphatase family protein [Bacillota bacterium]MBV1728473.1 alkaline phosphatase family protein [Desulforudis sp.]MBU4533567.1 alkaline phosphatase family protein [Bacillota bacterium]MBU4553740.1 alkaline phosphatase family protein [Bacillota bacterium]MBV1735762.1 alkaline phosphatase family protein [Desulforudis sp.]
MFTRRCFLFVLTLLLAVCFSPWAAAAPSNSTGSEQSAPEASYSKQIFIVVIDGLQSSALQRAQVPNINGVATAGLRMSDSLPVWPADTHSSVASIITGADPESHGYLDALGKLQKPTILQLAEQIKIQTTVFDGTGELQALAEGTRHYQKANSDEKLIDALIKYLSEKNPYLNLVILAEPRAALERSGVESQEYLKAVTDADNHVGRLLHFLHNKGAYNQSMIIVTGTTGQPPIVIKGLPYKTGQVMPPAALVDIAPTLAYTLGVKLPGATGKVLWNVFDPGSLQNGFYLLEQRIRDLSETQIRQGQEIFRLRGEQLLVQQEKQEISADKARAAKAINQRDDEIKSLHNQINGLKTVIGGILILAGIGFVIEYRLLRKRFLLF